MRFLVRLEAKTPLSIESDGFRFHFPDDNADLWAVNLGGYVHAKWIHTGIGFRVWIDADDHEGATTKAVAIGENVCNLLSVTHAAWIRLSEATWTIDLDETANDRVLVQHFVNVLTTVPLPRQIDHTLLTSFASCWSAARTDESTNRQLGRAMWHLRKATMTDDLVESFNEVWLGLETLNHLLIRKHSLATKFVARYCDKCGAPMEVLGGSAGITFAIVQLARGTKETAKESRELRKSLHHGFATIYDDKARLPNLVPLLRDALVLALADLILLPQAEWSGLRRSTYSRPSSVGEFTARVRLYDLPVPLLLTLTAAPELTLQVVPPNTDDVDAAAIRTVFGNFRLGVRNHDGRWGDGQLTWIGHSDPEVFGASGENTTDVK